MKHLVATLLCAVFGCVGLSGCGATANDSKFKVINGNGGGDENSKTGTELPLPAMTTLDLHLTALEELARVERSIDYLFNLPNKTNPEGCLNFRSRAGKTNFLTVNFDRCTYELAAPDAAAKLQFKFIGDEVFVDNTRSGGNTREASSRLALRILRLSTPPKLALAAPYFRRVKLTLPPKDTDARDYAYAFEATSMRGKTDVDDVDFFAITMRDGRWLMESRPLLKEGSALSVRYRPINSSAETVLTLTAETDVSFGKCRRPMGEFSYRVQSPAANGRIKTDGQGLLDIGTNKRTAWPVNCLEDKG